MSGIPYKLCNKMEIHEVTKSKEGYLRAIILKTPLSYPPAQLIITKSAWADYYHLTYESPEDGSLSFTHVLSKAADMLKNLPILSKYVKQDSTIIITSTNKEADEIIHHKQLEK